MSKHLYLCDVYSALELYDKLLGVYAESLALPTSEIVWVTCISSQFTDRVSCILARTVKNLEVQKRFTLCSSERVQLAAVDGWSGVYLPL